MRYRRINFERTLALVVFCSLFQVAAAEEAAMDVRPVPSSLNLSDMKGEMRSLEEFRGRVVIVGKPSDTQRQRRLLQHRRECRRPVLGV